MATIKEVAQRAGVSVTTVSRVLNKRGYISQEMHDKIYATMEELNYQPNEVARSLTRRRTKIIGLLVPSVDDPYFGEVVNQLILAAMRHGYKVMIYASDGQNDRALEYVGMLKANQVDGIIISLRSRELDALLDDNLPVVSFERIKVGRLPTVLCDNHMGGRIGVLIEVNCETDFVANGEPFNNFVKGVAAVVAKENPADVDALMGCPWVTGNGTVKDAKDELFLAIRENMSIRRFARIADGFSVPYVHMKGKIGVIVNLTVEGCDATEIGKDIAMQIAALNPRFWDKSQVTQDVLDEEKEVMLGQMANDPKMANKPDQVKEKIVMGKLNKFYAENCLLQQAFVKDGDVSVEQYMNNAAKALGGKVSFNTAVRFEKGEGIEKKQENFAAEIASMVNGNK